MIFKTMSNRSTSSTTPPLRSFDKVQVQANSLRDLHCNEIQHNDRLMQMKCLSRKDSLDFNVRVLIPKGLFIYDVSKIVSFLPLLSLILIWC